MTSPPVEKHTPAAAWPEQGQWTFDDWLRLPDDGFRYEIIEGELYVSPPPSVEHQNAVSSLLAEMRQYARKKKLGLVLTSPIGVRLPESDAIVEPDVLFVSKAKAHIVKKDFIEGAPDLVVEVLSPSNWMIDRGRKQETYRQAGVGEYWIVDYRARTVDVYVLEDGEFVQRGHYREGDSATSETLTGFAIEIAEVFAQ
jgi:Uma2 family endonuclease